jgi:hypothetical protein
MARLIIKHRKESDCGLCGVKTTAMADETRRQFAVTSALRAVADIECALAGTRTGSDAFLVRFLLR